MDFGKFVDSLASSIIWAFIGVLLVIAAVWFFDRIHPIDFHGEIEKGNVAAAVFLGSVVLGISLIIFAAVR